MAGSSTDKGLRVRLLFPLAALAASAVVLATLVFGATGLLVLYHDQIATGSPIMLSLLIPLTVTALLSAVAFWRA